VAVVIGNWLEFYDFLAFTFFAVMIGRAFFPGESEFADPIHHGSEFVFNDGKLKELVCS